jgi:hypothetical protein
MNTMVEMYRGHEIKAGIEESSKAWKISVDVFPIDDANSCQKIGFKLVETFDRTDGAVNALSHMVSKAKQRIDEILG